MFADGIPDEHRVEGGDLVNPHPETKFKKYLFSKIMTLSVNDH